MAQQTRNTLKAWFETSDKPTQQQFWDWLDSYVHKNDVIPLGSIEDLTQIINQLGASLLTGTGTGNFSVTIPADRIVDMIWLQPAANQVVNVGYTPGGDEIAAEMPVSASNPQPLDIGYGMKTGGTVYISGISGTYNYKIYIK